MNLKWTSWVHFLIFASHITLPKWQIFKIHNTQTWIDNWRVLLRGAILKTLRWPRTLSFLGVGGKGQSTVVEIARRQRASVFTGACQHALGCDTCFVTWISRLPRSIPTTSYTQSPFPPRPAGGTPAPAAAACLMLFEYLVHRASRPHAARPLRVTLLRFNPPSNSSSTPCLWPRPWFLCPYWREQGAWGCFWTHREHFWLMTIKIYGGFLQKTSLDDVLCRLFSGAECP